MNIYEREFFIRILCDLNIFKRSEDFDLIMDQEEYENSNLEEIFGLMWWYKQNGL